MKEEKAAETEIGLFPLHYPILLIPHFPSLSNTHNKYMDVVCVAFYLLKHLKISPIFWLI